MWVKEGCRVELHELHIGHIGSGPPANGDAVSGCDIGIAGKEINLACASGCQDGEAGTKSIDLASLFVQDIGPQAAVLLQVFPAQFRFGNQVDCNMVFIESDVWMSRSRFNQCPFDFAGRLRPWREESACGCDRLPGSGNIYYPHCG